MIYEDIASNSPAMQVFNQLSASSAIAQKAALQLDVLLGPSSAVAAMFSAQHTWTNGMSQVAVSLSKELQKWVLQPTLAEKTIESLRRNIVEEVISNVPTYCWEPSRIASAFESSPTQRVFEAMNRDVASIATTMKLAQKEWAVEAVRVAKIAESLQHNLATECATLAASWKSIGAARVLDSMNVLSTLNLPIMPAIHQTPAWPSPIFLDQLEVPMAPKMRTGNIVGRRSSRNYQMAEAFYLLSDFERDLRDFIHDAMLEVFGAGWEKSRLPNGMYGEWVGKREKARAAGESSERLIDYADFTDYVIIISQKNNWNEVFRSQFGRLQFVQESLYRLQPIRVCTMHSRILPREMWQVLQTETMLLSDKMWN